MISMDEQKRFRHIVALVAFAGALLGGCGSSASEEVDAGSAHELLSRGALTLVDIRQPSEWQETGVVEGAELLNMVAFRGRNDFAEAVLESVDGNYDAPIALICRTGNRSSRVLPMLEEYGFTNVYHVPEGMVGSRFTPGWIGQNLPVVECDHEHC